jgi:hypothetical protein
MKNILLIFLCILFSSCARHNKPVSELIAVEQGEVIRQIAFVGRIRSEKTSLIRAPIDSQLVQLYKSLGSSVTIGDLVAVIEQPKDDTHVTNIIQDQGRLNQIKLKQSQAVAQIATAKKEFERMSRLLASGSIASGEHEAAKTALSSAQKDLESLKAEEQTIVQSLQVKQKTQKNSTRNLHAEAAGTITQLWTSEDNITPGMTIPKDTIIAMIEQAGQYVLKGEVVESDYVRLKIGQPVIISLVFNPNLLLKGTIKSISPFAREDQFGIGRFDVTAAFTGGTGDLKTGLEARGQVVLERKVATMRLPRSAVKVSGNEYLVSLPGKEGTVVRGVVPGLVGDQFLEIISGVEPGQKVYQAYVEPNR